MLVHQAGIALLAGTLQLAASGGVAVATEAEATAAGDPEIEFDHETFYTREAVARWLLRYDRVAWLTTDLVRTESQAVLERLGREWFCVLRDGRWHAVYGKYDPEDDRYDVVLHYAATDEGLKNTQEPLPQKVMKPLGRALHSMIARLDPVLSDAGAQFNTYVRRLDDDRIETWMLPAWQADGRFAFGTEYRFVFDPRGRTVVEESAPEPRLTVENLTPDMKLLIPNDDADLPSVGQIFAILLARDFVSLAGVRSRGYVTALVDVPGTDRQVWAHVYVEHELETSLRKIQEMAARDVSAEEEPDDAGVQNDD